MRTNASGGWAHYYLHSDHLGSTVFVTAQGSATHSSAGYYAFGRPRTGGIGLTDHKFTGQKRDGTGLMYFNARYYDPRVPVGRGQFLSPDTIVPDPSNLFDYNRYMYTRGNPMKYNDPTGHCAVRGDGSPDREQDGACWAAAGEVSDAWPVDPQWWSDRWKISPDAWLTTIATQDFATEHYIRDELQRFWAPKYQAWGVHHPRYNPAPQMHPVTSQDQAFERMNDVIGKTICSTWDCVAIGLDVASIGLSVGGDAALGCAVASAGAAAGVCIPAGAVATGVDFTVTGYSVARTWKMYYDGNASLVDGIVSSTTGSVSLVPGVGEAAGIVQLSYDLADPGLSIFIPNRGAK